MPQVPGTHLTFDRLDDLLARANPRNPKTHDLPALEQSLDRFGFVAPAIVNDRDGSLMVGHGRAQALARRMAADLEPPNGVRVDSDGMWRLPVIHGLDLDENEGLAYLLADNRTTELGGYDSTLLAEVLQGLEGAAAGLVGIGYTDYDLARLLRSLDVAPPPPPVDPDAAPKAPSPRNRYVSLGEAYALGDHRLLVADSREAVTFKRLCADSCPGLLVTDPPYGVNYQGGTGRRLTIRNDDPEGLPDLLEQAFAAVDGVLAPGAALYVFHPAGALAPVFSAAFLRQGWQLRQQLIWAKDTPVLGHSDFHYVHEPILYGYRPGGGRRGRGARGWYGGNDCASVFSVPRPKASRLHPTMKPVELISQILRISSRRGDIVLDPFLGSGSTLIAAERLGRRCFAVELDPAYAQVTIERWQRFTGQRARRIDEAWE